MIMRKKKIQFYIENIGIILYVTICFALLNYYVDNPLTFIFLLVGIVLVVLFWALKQRGEWSKYEHKKSFAFDCFGIWLPLVFRILGQYNALWKIPSVAGIFAFLSINTYRDYVLNFNQGMLEDKKG